MDYVVRLASAPTHLYFYVCIYAGASGKDKFSAICRDGRLFYQGQHYGQGHHIVIDDKQDSPVQ